MIDALPVVLAFGLAVAVLAAVGLRLGMLVAPRLERLAEHDGPDHGREDDGDRHD